MSGAVSLSSIASFGGMAMSTMGAYSNSRASKAALEAQAQVAANNRQIAQWQADDALKRGDRAVSRSRMRTNQIKGTQRASMAANGVDLGVGSALNILVDTEYFGEVDAGTIKDNAAKEAWALRNQAANFGSESELMRSRADAEKPWMAAGTSLLTSAGRVAGSWYPSSGGSRKTVPDYPGAEY
jgi:hypothetical protein